MTDCRVCGVHLTEENIYPRKGRETTICKSCFNAYCIDRWRKTKTKAVQYKGGKCERCGYDKYEGALEFHHIDPNTKDCDWGKLKKRSWNAITKELDKCICVCSNCHKEIHNEIYLNDSVAQLDGAGTF